MGLVELGWDNVLSILVPLVAVIPAFIAVRAYARTRTVRVGLFAAAFVLILGKGLVIAMEVLWFEGSAALDALELVAEAGVIVLFTWGMLQA